MRKKLFILSVFLLISTTFFAQNGYIYVHKKAISEVASVDFQFNLNQGATSIKTFSLNDKPDALNAFDLGNSHGAGEGQLWAVINDAENGGVTHTISGRLYTRPAGSSQWNATTGVISSARSVDGIGLNTAVISDETGAVVLYNANNTLSTIWTPGAHSNVTIIDVASGGPGGVIVAVGNNGRLFKYTGNGTNDSWSLYSNAAVVNVFRADVNPANQEILFLKSNDEPVYRLASGVLNAAPTAIAAPANSSSSGNNVRDIAVSNEGVIFSTYRSANGEQNVWEYNGTIWADNSKSRGLSGLTAGAGNQAWGITKVNANQVKHSIYSRAIPGTTGNAAVADWLDDERVRTNIANGNSIMIPVPAGTYTLSETATAGWNNSNILIYDPTNNSSFSGSTSTINVAAGEVVNVVYSNALQNPVGVPAVCGTNLVVDFGRGTATYGPAFNGFTSYHYRPAGIVGDTYYSVVKNSSEWYSGQNLTLTNHTPGDPNGYFGIFNASYATDDFFRQTITGLAVGTVYEFAFWVADLSPGTTIRPNITMGISNPATGVLLNSISTGNISSPTWTQYKFNFTATSTTAELFLKNNSIGGSGNDLAIDDISFAPAPPVLSPSTPPTGITILCSNYATPYQFSNSQSGGVWSTNTPALVSVDATSGIVTTKVGASGTATIIYTYTSGSGCTSSTTLSIPVGNCACYNDANTAIAGTDSKQGVTLLQRAGADNGNWPMVRKSAHTVLESNTKGFVITRMTTGQINAIASPQEGMMVYDQTAKCLKLYDGTGWSCFNTATCP